MLSNNGTSGHERSFLGTASFVNASHRAAQAPPFSVGEEVGIGIVLGLIMFVSIAGNILVCVAVMTDRKLRKASNLFLVSLAAADLIVSCIVMPLAVANDLLGYWPFAEAFCNVWVSLDVLSATASILHLCAISLDRYVHMRNPFKYEQWMSVAKCSALVAVTWLAAVLISVVPINLGWHYSSDHLVQPADIANPPKMSFPTNDTGGVEGGAGYVCTLDINPTYAVVSSAVSFYIPCIIMLGIYCNMYKLAHQHLKKIQRMQAVDAKKNDHHNKMTRRTKMACKVNENKAMFTLGVILGAFLFSWFPFFAVNVIHAFCKCVPQVVFQVFTWLGYFNSAQNPVIYSIFNTDFRNSFLHILRCRRRHRSKMDAKQRRVTNHAVASTSQKPMHALDGVLLPLLPGSGYMRTPQGGTPVPSSLLTASTPQP